MEAARELAQLLERQVELLGGAVRGSARASRGLPRLELRAREPQGQRERDEPLLRTVVEVALELAPLLVAGLDDAGARRLQVLARLRARDRERDELAEAHQPRLAVRRERLARRDRDGAPGTPATKIGAATVER